LLLFLFMRLSLSDVFDWLSIVDAGSKQGDVPPTSWLTRLEIWQVARQMLGDYPVIGGGLYTFDPVSRANYVYETILPRFNLTHAHNLFLQTGTSLGISGILALFGIWGTVVAKLWQTGRADEGRIRGLSAVFASSIAGYLFFNLVDTITFGQKPGLIIWVILAGGMGLSRLVGEQTAVNQTAVYQAASTPVYYRAAKTLVAFGPLLAFGILLFSPALPSNLVNLQLDRAYLDSSSDPELVAVDFAHDGRRAGLVHYLAGDIDQALGVWRMDPHGAAYLEGQGTIALMAGRPALAISWYNLALELAPDSAETYLWRGTANEARGTMAMAEADFRKAAEYSAGNELTNSSKAYIHYRLGILLTEKEDWQAAAEAFTQATIFVPDEPWYYQDLGDALTELGDWAGAAAAYEKVNK
jgi:hypothetical protein